MAPLSSASRATTYVAKPTAELRARLDEASAPGLYVVQEPGPTSFVLKAEGSERKHRVNIGSVHSCSCGARQQPCVHTAFVLLRVFRLSPADPRVWQSSLTDAELEKLVEARARAMAAMRANAQIFGTAAPSSSSARRRPARTPAGQVPRRELSEEEGEPCPICYEELTPEDEEGDTLDWCRKGCGKNVHRRCLAMLAEHSASVNKPLTCPLCRSDWGTAALPVDADAAGGDGASSGAPAGAVHRHARCRACRACPMHGHRYRCLQCPERLELCADCFAGGMHSHHAFAFRERPGGQWMAAPRRPVAAAGSGGGGGGGFSLVQVLLVAALALFVGRLNVGIGGSPPPPPAKAAASESLPTGLADIVADN